MLQQLASPKISFIYTSFVASFFFSENDRKM